MLHSIHFCVGKCYCEMHYLLLDVQVKYVKRLRPWCVC